MGWARGGRLDALASTPLRGLPLLVVAAALVLCSFALPLPPAAARGLHGAGYLLGLAAVWQNRRSPWSLPILVGVGLNTAVICLNGGQMPVAPEALARLRQAVNVGAAGGLDPRHVVMGHGTRLAALGDTIALGVGGLGLIASPGDLLMAFGLGGFVQDRMTRARAGPPQPRPNA